MKILVESTVGCSPIGMRYKKNVSSKIKDQLKLNLIQEGYLWKLLENPN